MPSPLLVYRQRPYSVPKRADTSGMGQHAPSVETADELLPDPQLSPGGVLIGRSRFEINVDRWLLHHTRTWDGTQPSPFQKLSMPMHQHAPFRLDA